MTFATFKNKGEQQYGEISFLTNLPEGSLDRLESLEEGYDSEKTFDPRFAVLLSQCLVGDGRSDQKQAHLFEDIFGDFDDGTLCALCLRSERNSEASPVLLQEYSTLSSNAKGKLLDSLRFVAPQRFVTSSLVQTLTCIDNFLPGTELEVHTTTSPHAAALRPMIKGVRVLTLPYLEFEYCNVYRGTYGKSLPLIHRHPDAIVILWNKGDHDHVFFLTMSQLLPCLKDVQANSWSMIVFWIETKGSVARTGPDVGLDFTNQPAPAPDMPPQPPAGEDEVDHPGYDDPHGWTMRIRRRLKANTQNRISAMILLSWIQVVTLRRSLPVAALSRLSTTISSSRQNCLLSAMAATRSNPAPLPVRSALAADRTPFTPQHAK